MASLVWGRFSGGGGAFRSGQRAGGRNRGARRGETGKESPGEAQTSGGGAWRQKGARYGRARGEPPGLFLRGFRFESDGGKRSLRGKKTGKGQARPDSGCRVKKKLPVSETRRAFCSSLVPRGRLELPRHSSLPPQDSVSTSSTTWARSGYIEERSGFGKLFFQFSRRREKEFSVVGKNM